MPKPKQKQKRNRKDRKLTETATMPATVDSDKVAEQNVKKASLGSGSITPEFASAVVAYLQANPTMDRASLVRDAVAYKIGYEGAVAPASTRGGAGQTRKLKAVQSKTSKVLDQIAAMLGQDKADAIRRTMVEQGLPIE